MHKYYHFESSQVGSFIKTKEDFLAEYYRHLERYINREYDIAADGEEKLSRIYKICSILGEDARIVRRVEYLHVYVAFSVSVLSLCGDLLKLMGELAKLSPKIEIYHADGCIHINATVPYYAPGQMTPHDMATRDVSGEIKSVSK